MTSNSMTSMPGISVGRSAIVPGSVERDRSAWRQHAHQVADRHPFTRIRQHFAFSAGRTEQIGNDQIVKLAAQVDGGRVHQLSA
jgi:2-methylaconitate cis-trans-isomerase PrpF